MKQWLPFSKSKNRYTLNTLESLPMVGLGNGRGNEDKITQENKARESLMIIGMK